MAQNAKKSPTKQAPPVKFICMSDGMYTTEEDSLQHIEAFIQRTYREQLVLKTTQDLEEFFDRNKIIGKGPRNMYALELAMRTERDRQDAEREAAEALEKKAKKRSKPYQKDRKHLARNGKK